MKYYLRVRGKVFGPFDEQQLLDLKDKGKLKQTSELSSDKSQWSQAGGFGFLFTPSEVASEPVKTYAPTEVAQSAAAPTQAAPPPSPLPPSGGPAEWYYSIDGSSGYGPVEASEIVRQIQSEVLHADSLVWRDGQSARPIHTISAFARYVTPQNTHSQPMRQPLAQRSAIPQYTMPRREFTEQATAASRSFFGWLFGWLLDFSFNNLELQTTNLLQFQVVQLWLSKIGYAIHFILTILFCVGATMVTLFGSATMVYQLDLGLGGPFLMLLSFLYLLFIYICALWWLVVIRALTEFWLLVVDWIVAGRKAAKMYTANEQSKFE